MSWQKAKISRHLIVDFEGEKLEGYDNGYRLGPDNSMCSGEGYFHYVGNGKCYKVVTDYKRYRTKEFLQMLMNNYQFELNKL